MFAAKTNIVRPPQNQTVIISTQVTFECGIIRDENTLPVWEWFFYKSPDFVERQINNSNRYFISEIGSLIISGVSAQDIGKYRCHVISAGGNDSRTASLNVIGKNAIKLFLAGVPSVARYLINMYERMSVQPFQRTLII